MKWVVLLLLACAGCATTPDARAVMGPCSRARLAREFPLEAAFQGCYGVVDGPRELHSAQIVLLTSIPSEVLVDEPPRYQLATLGPFVPAFAPSWEQLSNTHARLLWMQGATGVEMCVQMQGERLKGHIVVLTDQPPFLQVAGPVTLAKQPCPS